jgi:hypothetical protein
VGIADALWVPRLAIWLEGQLNAQARAAEATVPQPAAEGEKTKKKTSGKGKGKSVPERVSRSLLQVHACRCNTLVLSTDWKLHKNNRNPCLLWC